MRNGTRPVRPRRRASRTRRALALARLLRQHGAELMARRRSLRDELPATNADVKDEVECSVDQLARAVGAALLEVSAATVRGIETALHRLEIGTYGSCMDCGQRIPSARLKVLPFAERCCECQYECDSAASHEAPAFGVIAPAM